MAARATEALAPTNTVHRMSPRPVPNFPHICVRQQIFSRYNIQLPNLLPFLRGLAVRQRGLQAKGAGWLDLSLRPGLKH